MSNLSLDDAIDKAGGPVTEENCPAVIPAAQLASIYLSLNDIAQRLTKVLDETASKLWFVIALTNSTSYGCQVRVIEDGGFAILIPVGMLARIRVLSRLLLSYWDEEFFPRVIRSPLDNVPGDRNAIPPLLRPLFLEESEPDYWQRLLELDQTVSLDDIAENEVQELVHVATLFIVSHEFTHILHGHFDLLHRADTEELPLTVAEIKRGIELDADDGGTAYALRMMNEAIDEAVANDQDVHVESAWLRLAYAVTMIFAITDTHRKYFGAYDQGAYNHPMVRCELFFNSARNYFDAPDSIMKIWNDSSNDGWIRCIRALENLTVDALSGKFGKLAEGVEPAPIHTLNYSALPHGITDRETYRKCEAAVKLMWEVRKLLPLFENSISDVTAESENQTNDQNSVKSKTIIGVCGLEEDNIETLKDRYGSASVVVYSPSEIPEDISKEKRAAMISEYNQRQAEFYESVKHMVIQYKDSHSFSLFTASLVQLRMERMDTVTCITDQKMEGILRDLINSYVKGSDEPTVEQMVEAGKLLFLRKFDLSAFENIVQKNEMKGSKAR